MWVVKSVISYGSLERIFTFAQITVLKPSFVDKVGLIESPKPPRNPSLFLWRGNEG